MLKLHNKRIAIFSDIHWGKTKNSDDKIENNQKFIDWLIEECLQRGITDVAFLGDWFDDRSYICSKTLDASHLSLLKLSQSMRVIMVVGNHDCYYKETNEITSVSVFKNIPNVIVVDAMTEGMFTNNHKCAFVAWGHMDDLIGKKYSAVMGHLDFQGAKMLTSVNKTGWTMEEIFKVAPLVFSGHFHLRNEQIFKNGRIITVGCPLQLDWGDRNDSKGFYIFDSSDSTYEFIENVSSPKHVAVKWTDIVNRTVNPTKYSNDMLKIIFDGKMAQVESLKKMVNVLNSKRPISCTVEFLDASVGPTLSSVSDGAVSLQESFVAFMEDHFKQFPDQTSNLDLPRLKNMIIDVFKDIE